MKPLISAQAGTFESSDVLVLIEPLEIGKGRVIELSSTVEIHYKSEIEAIIQKMLNLFEMNDIHLIMKDKGALNPTIEARLETAIKRSLQIQEGTLL